MKKIITVIVCALAFALSSSAQIPGQFIGYFSYEKTLQAQPEYAIVQKNIEELRSQYAEELKKAEKEFSEKYELFLEQQVTMAAAIREKRQSELQLMLENNVKFREESKRLLLNAENEAMKPLHEKLNAALKHVAEDRQLIAILNTDGNACPYLNPSFTVDLNEILAEELSK